MHLLESIGKLLKTCKLVNMEILPGWKNVKKKVFFFNLLLYCNTIPADKEDKYHLTNSLLKLQIEYCL